MFRLLIFQWRLDFLHSKRFNCNMYTHNGLTVQSTVVSNLSECGLFSYCVEVSPLLQAVQVHQVGQQSELGQAVKQG